MWNSLTHQHWCGVIVQGAVHLNEWTKRKNCRRSSFDNNEELQFDWINHANFFEWILPQIVQSILPQVLTCKFPTHRLNELLIFGNYTNRLRNLHKLNKFETVAQTIPANWFVLVNVREPNWNLLIIWGYFFHFCLCLIHFRPNGWMASQFAADHFVCHLISKK